MSNAFICQFGVGTFRVDIFLTSGVISMYVIIESYGYIL